MSGKHAVDEGCSARDGVSDAWDFWLAQHPVSVPEIIGDAIKESFSKWLDAHSDEIIEAIAAKARVDL